MTFLKFAFLLLVLRPVFSERILFRFVPENTARPMSAEPERSAGLAPKSLVPEHLQGIQYESPS